MNILVVNDDGYKSEGITILAEAMKAYGKVYIVAPNSEQSAKSASITIRQDIPIHQHTDTLYSVEGTPADAVRMAIQHLDLPIDFIVSGINNGFNIGIDTIYSGTIGAAMQGLMYGIPSIAFSSEYNHLDDCKHELGHTLEWIFKHQLYSDTYVLNVNFQSHEFPKAKGIKITYVDIYPKGTMYKERKRDGFTDREAVHQGYISVTPLKLGNGDPQLNQELLQKLHS